MLDQHGYSNGVASFDYFVRDTGGAIAAIPVGAATAFLVTLATTRSWKEKRQWKEKTFFHTLTIYDGFEDLVNGLEIGDLVRFKGEIDSWSTKIEGTDDYRQGVTLVARSRRIIARKRKGEDEAPDDTPAVEQAPQADFADEDIPY